MIEAHAHTHIQYTVAPALVGAVVLIAFCKSSDYFRERGFHQSGSSVFSLVGYILLATISSSNIPVLYLAMFLCTIGVSFIPRTKYRQRQ